MSQIAAELDMLKKEVLSENQRRLQDGASPSAAGTDDAISVMQRREARLDRPSRREAYIVYYKLNGKSNVKKVQFSYALTGRTNQIGILQKLKGKKLGRGCLLVPAVNLAGIQEFFKYWDVDIATQKILLVD